MIKNIYIPIWLNSNPQRFYKCDKVLHLHSNMVKFKCKSTSISSNKYSVIYIPIWLNSNPSSFQPLYFKLFIYLFCRSHLYLLISYNIFYKSQAIFLIFFDISGFCRSPRFFALSGIDNFYRNLLVKSSCIPHISLSNHFASLLLNKITESLSFRIYFFNSICKLVICTFERRSQWRPEREPAEPAPRRCR